MEDIVTTVRQGPHFASVSIQEQSVRPVGESKSDYEIVAAIADKLGYGDEFTGGLSTLDLQKIVFDAMKMDKLTTWEDFYEKKTYVYKTATDWEEDSPGFRKFYDDPKNNPLQTPTGLLEFYSEALATHFPDDKERPPFPQWVERGITHDESLSSERAGMFPLLLMSNHPRWRTHAQGDDIVWARETPPARCSVSTATTTSPSGSIPGTPKPAASKTATSSRSSTNAASCSWAPACGNA